MCIRDRARADLADHLTLVLDLSDPDTHTQGQALVGELGTILRTFSGTGLPVYIHYQRPDARGRLLMGKDWRVRPTDELLKRLRQLLGTDAVRTSYERIDFEGVIPNGHQTQPQLAPAT